MSVFEVLKHLLRKYNLWVLLLLKFGWVGTLMAIQGLWAGPYLMNVYQLSKQETGNILLFIALGAIIGAPLIGYIADRAIIASKKLLMIGAIGTIITLLPMVFLTAGMSLNFIKLLFFSFGVFSYFNIVGWVNIRENIEPSMIGTASGIVNFVGFFGGAIFQQIMGFIIARAPMVNSSLAASGFRSAFLFCLVYLIIALSVFSTQRKAATD